LIFFTGTLAKSLRSVYLSPMRSGLLLPALCLLSMAQAFAQTKPPVPPLRSEGEPSAGTTTVVIDPGPAPQAPVMQEAVIALKSGKPELALQEAEAALALNADNPSALEIKGRALTSLGKLDEAQTVLFQLLKKNPEHHAAHYYLGEAAFRGRSYNEALQYYGVYSDKEKEDGLVRLKMVYCLVGMQQPVPASKIANSLNPNDEVDPFYPLARAAISRVTGDSARYEEWIQLARTNYSNPRINEFMPDLMFVIQGLEAAEAEAIAAPVPP
jgi:tetratricopeptide (TPR) repeat protein